MRASATQRNSRSAALLSISMRPSSQKRHVTADDVAANKPAPDGYVAAAKRFELAPERCLVVEDSPQGIHAGRAAGMDVVAILRGRERSFAASATETFATLARFAESLQVDPKGRVRI